MRNLTIPDVLEMFWLAKSSGLRVYLVGRIESYDPANQTATVKPLLKETIRNASGSDVLESLPVLQGVPVAFPGGGGARLTFPVAAGDYCELHFADRSIDQWKALGGEVDPIERSRHALKDAVAHVGVRPPSDPYSDADASAVTLGFEGGAQIRIEPGASGPASTPVAKEGSSVVGFAGPYTLTANVATGAGSQKVWVP